MTLKKSVVGELIINGNQIEFCPKVVENASSAVYIGSNTEYHYKVVTNSVDWLGTNNALDLASRYNGPTEKLTVESIREIYNFVRNC